MKKVVHYLEWIPFAICLGSLLIYIVYTIRVKLNPAIIVTDNLVSTLKTYLIIALISLFIGLLIVLIKKIRKLSISTEENTIKEEKIVTEKPKIVVEEKVVENPINEEKTIIEETKKQYVYKLEGVVCPECGNEISPKAAICPHCGILFDEEILRVIEKYEKKKTKVVRKNSLLVTFANILLIVIFIFLIFLLLNPLKNRIDTYRKSYEIIQRQ